MDKADVSAVRQELYRMEPVKKTVNERLMDRLGERDEMIKALVNNEAINRQRIDHLEKNATSAFRLWQADHDILSRPFIGRLLWLILGK